MKKYKRDYVKYYLAFKQDKSFRQDIEKITKILPKTKFKKILDVGCGTGKHAYLLSKKGYKPVGIGLSKQMIEYAKKHYKKIPFKVANVTNFKLKDKFNAIIALDSVLTFLPSKKDFNKPMNFDKKILKLFVHILKFDKLIKGNPFQENINVIKSFNSNSLEALRTKSEQP